MSTINLRNGLEALYYFGEQDFNPQRNLLQDHSGYGRHATANGGPTVGVNGPKDFEATGLDGADDFFTQPFTPSDSSFTIASLALQTEENSNNTTESDILANLGKNRGLEFGDVSSPDSKTQLAVKDGSGNEVRQLVNSDTETFVTYIGRYDGEFLLVENSTGSKGITSVPFTPIISNSRFDIGRNSVTQGRYWGGKISFVAFWSRAISRSEIERLKDLTAALRKRL